MLRQSSSRCHRSKKLLRPKHSIKIFLLVAASVWLMYQLTHSYSSRRRAVVAVENAAAAMDGEVTRRRLGRKGFVDFAGDASGGDGVRGIIGVRSNVAVEAEMERGFTSDQLSKGEQGEPGGGEETGEEDDDDDVYIAEDGLPGDDEDDDGTDFHQGDEMDGSVAPPVNSSDAISAPPLVNGVADGMNTTSAINTSLNDSAVSTNSSGAA